MTGPEIANILVVDDTPANLQLLAGMLKDRGYKVRPVTSGRMALRAAKRETPDLVLLDVNMPEMNGFEVCAEMKADSELRAVPIIFISALHEAADKVKAFQAGGVDYITKPFQFEEVQARVDTHLKLRELTRRLEERNTELRQTVEEQVRELLSSQMSTIFALAKLAESRDDDTGVHLERVQIYCRLLAEHLMEKGTGEEGIDRAFVTNIFHASPLHDVGKVAIPDAILLKPGKLTPEEFESMKAHAELGSRTLEAVRHKYPGNAFLNMGIQIARSHHERWDGKGYPDRLAGHDIPICARIMAIADVYDALTSKRCYKPAFSHEKSSQIIVEGAGSQFDARIVEAFIAVQGEFQSTREHFGG